MMGDDNSNSPVQKFMQDNVYMLGAGAVTLAGAAAASFYFTSRPDPIEAPIDLDNQSIVVDQKENVRVSAQLAAHPERLITYLYDDAKTVYQALQRGLKISNNGACLGKRSAPGKPYTWVTYRQIIDRAHNFGAGLIADGETPGNNTFVGIFSGNSIEWTVADMGCHTFSMVPVPLYDTLGISACYYIINQTELRTVVTDGLEKIRNLLKDKEKMPSLQRIVFMGQQIPEDLVQMARENKVKIHLFTDVENLGEQKKIEPMPPSPDDLATLCYTSGTTGDPKGVMLTHANIIINLSAVYHHVNTVLNIEPNDVHLSYLPLAHMFERGMHVIVLMHGAKIGYFSGNIRQLTEDLNELKPSLFPTVPRVLNRIFDKVQAGVDGSWFKSTLFKMAMRSKMMDVKQGVVRNDTIWDRLLFSKIQKFLGGRVRLIITGSAPLSAPVLDFIRCSFGCLVLEGYGQTEACAGITFNIPGETEAGNVGCPLVCNYVKLVDVPEMDYFAKDDKGEVCAKGGNVMKGYFKSPEKTAEALDSDGWLHTGDIGIWLPNGTLKIVDRKKNIFKLAQGEYVAVEKVENVYQQSKFVGQVFVEGDSLKPSLMAVVVPDEEMVKKFGENNNLPSNMAEFCQSEQAKTVVLKDMKHVADANKLKGFEQVKDIHLHPELLTVASGLLTPSLKNKRPALRKFFKKTIDDLYTKHSL